MNVGSWQRGYHDQGPTKTAYDRHFLKPEVVLGVVTHLQMNRQKHFHSGHQIKPVAVQAPVLFGSPQVIHQSCFC